MFGIAGANARVAAIALTDNEVDATNQTIYTFSAKSIGAASVNRRIIVCVIMADGDAGSTVDTVTVGGISATAIVQADGGSGNTRRSEIWLATVPTGTTADIVVTNNEAVLGVNIAVYRAIGCAATATDTQTDITATANAVSATLNIPVDGVSVGNVVWGSTGATRTTTWTNMTEDVDQSSGGALSQSTAIFTGLDAARLVTATASGALSEEALTLASFGVA